MAEAGDVFVQLHLHHAILFQGVHGAGFGFARLDKAQRLRDRNLENQNLIFGEWGFRDAVAGLDQRGVFGALGGVHPGNALEELADRHRIGGVVGALVDDLQHVRFANHAGGDLNTACAPAVRHRHFTPAERHLIARNGHRFEDGAADHAFGLFIQISKVIAAEVSHFCAPVADVSVAPVQPGNRRNAAA